MSVGMAPPRCDGWTRSSALVTRSLSAAVLAVPVLVIVHVGSPLFEILIVVAGAILTREWCLLCVQRVLWIYLWVFGLALIAAIVAVSAGRWELSFGFMLAGALGSLASSHGRTWLAVGVLYIGLPCLSLVWLRSDPVAGRETVLWLVSLVWASDIGAYAIGRLVGGPKLAPRLSPNKTWAGLFGGMISAGLAGAGAALVLAKPVVSQLALLSVVLGAIAQGGDLFESWVKRRFGVKDAGRLIPGHGGLLDRVDALMAASVAAALMAVIWNGGVWAWK